MEEEGCGVERGERGGTGRERGRRRERGEEEGEGGGGDGERENSNSKPLVPKDSSVRSIWTYLIAIPCYATSTNKHEYATSRYYDRQTDGQRQTHREKGRKRER